MSEQEQVAEKTVVFKGVPFTIREGSGSAPFFVLGIRKSGSSLLNSLMRTLAERNGLHFVDVAGTLFQSGIAVTDWQEDEGLAAILAPGNVYGGFRNSPKSLYKSPLFRHGRKILLVRDPRDALVSEYFSNAYSHSLPKAGEAREGMLELRKAALAQEIDDYVLKMARPLKRTLREYMVMQRDPNCRTFRYEDVIFDKGRLLDDICAFFGWSLADPLRKQILGWADVRPTEERPTEFVRRVTPGDHREKLRPAVIAELNDLLSEEMERFGYTAA